MNPNIYDFATSELSQDATLAYILSWAKPEYRKEYPVLNGLGERLLRALVQSAANVANSVSPLDGATISTVDVPVRPLNDIDVSVTINDNIFLIIEDKIETGEHSDQIAKYIKKVLEIKTVDGEPRWKCVMAVYVKTGNECPPRCDHKPNYGVFLRPKLLDVLKAVPDTGNTIIENFRQHLQQWQDETDSFRKEIFDKWSDRAIQGYYIEIYDLLKQRLKQQGKPSEDFGGWHNVHNPQGGFLGFYWNWRDFHPQRCKLYLQIENAKRLQIRASDAKNETGKTHPDMLRAAFGAVEETIKREQERFKQIRICKPGTYRAGEYSAVADVLFDDQEIYLATNAESVLDLPATQQRLEKAMELVDAVCEQCKG